MTTKEIVTFLRERPLINQRGLENTLFLPSGTIRLAMAEKRDIPSKHLPGIIHELKKYGLVQ